jgi:hypothetical protein
MAGLKFWELSIDLHLG